jgi:hypothetical protein
MANLNEELSKANDEVRKYDGEMETTVLKLNVDRLEKKLAWLNADYQYHKHRKILFLKQSKGTFNSGMQI